MKRLNLTMSVIETTSAGSAADGIGYAPVPTQVPATGSLDAAAPQPSPAWREARRQRLLEAAGRVFATTPYEQASMDDVAREASIGKPTIYRYFPSKEALFEAVFIDALDAMDGRLAACLETPGPASMRLHSLILEMIPTFRDHLVSLRSLGEGAGEVDRNRRQIFRQRRASIEALLARVIREGCEEGSFRAVSPQIVAGLAIGMIWSGTAGLPASPTQAGRLASDSELARTLIDLIVHGVGHKSVAAAPPPRARRSA